MAVVWRTPRETVGKPLLRPWMAPPLIPGLVARPALSERLLSVVGDGPVALHGGAGYGKTSLATWLCHLPETRERFPGGLLWVTLGGHVAGAELAGRVNDLVEWLTGARPTFTEPRDAGERLGTLLDGAPEPLLLIIEDATSAQLDPFLTGGEHCWRLVTTRQRGGGGEHTRAPIRRPWAGEGIEVGAMTEAEAQRLLLRDLPGDVAPAVVEKILARTRLWPFPLGLANRAARRAVRHGATPETALRRIGEHHSIVQAGLDLLPPSYADRFAELAIFGPGVEIPLEILHLLWGGRFGEVARICEALADLSLVLRGRPGTIRLHDVIRDQLVRTSDPRNTVALHRRLLDAGDPWRDDYLIAHLAEHLAAADRPGELEEKLTDPRRALLRLQRHGPAALAADLAYGTSVAARKLERVIRRDSHLLGATDPPDALGAVLASRLDQSPAESRSPAESQSPTETQSPTKAQTPAESRTRAEHQTTAENPHLSLVNRPTTIPAVAAVCGTGRLVASISSASDTPTAQVWDRPDQKPVRTLGCVIDGPFVVARDGLWIACAAKQHINVWDVDADRLVNRHAVTAVDPTVMTLAPDDDSLVVCDANGRVWIVSAATGECRRDFPAHEGEIRAAAVSPDGSWMVTGGADGTAGIWDWETSKLLRRLTEPGITAVAPHTTWLAVGTGDGIAQIWDPESGRLLHRLRCEGPVTTMTAAGERLATGTSSGAIKIWNPRTGRPLTMMRVDSPIHDCRWFDGDRGLLVFGTRGTYAFGLS